MHIGMGGARFTGCVFAIVVVAACGRDQQSSSSPAASTASPSPSANAAPGIDVCSLFPSDGGPRPTYTSLWSRDALVLQERCERGEAKACTELGRLAVDGVGLPADDVRAEELFLYAAGHGDVSAWVALGDMNHREGYDVWPLALASYRKACDEGSLLGCARYGDLALIESPSWKTDVAYLERACDGGEPEGCRDLSNAIRDPFLYGPDHPEPDEAKADALAKQADALRQKQCDANDEGACLDIAMKLVCGQSSDGSGDGWECSKLADAASVSAGAAIFDRFCDAGSVVACARNARLLRMQGRLDLAQSIEAKLLDRCRSSELAACRALLRDDSPSYWGQLADDKGDATAAAGMKPLCDADISRACQEQGLRASSWRVSRRACWLGAPFGCTEAIEKLEAKATPGKVTDDLLELYAVHCSLGGYESERSCEKLEPLVKLLPCGLAIREHDCRAYPGPSCVIVGDAYRKGDGVAKDASKAAALYALACKASTRGGYGSVGLTLDVKKIDPACHALAEMTASGEGMSKDDARATELYALACAGNDGESCRIVGDRMRDGVGIPANAASATAAWERGCNLGDAESCKRVGKAAKSP
jgi:TPR repeat protein